MSATERAVAVMAGEESVTICAKCANMFQPTTNAREWQWLCRAQPQELRFSYLTGEETGTPYRECRHVNTDGNCPYFKEGINSLSPDRLIPDGHGGMVKPPEEPQ